MKTLESPVKITVDNEVRTCKVLYVNGNPTTELMLRSRHVDLVVCLYNALPEGVDENSHEDSIESNKLCELLKVMCSITTYKEDGSSETTKGTHDLDINKFKCYHVSGCEQKTGTENLALNKAISSVQTSVIEHLTEKYNTYYGSVEIGGGEVNKLTLAISDIVERDA